MRPVRLISLVAGIAVAVLLLLTLAPVPHPFSIQLAISGPEYASSAIFSPTSGSYVSGVWRTLSGDSVYLYIFLGPRDSGAEPNIPVYWQFGPSGSFSFTASNPPYRFSVGSSGSVETVSISGDVSYVIL